MHTNFASYVDHLDLDARVAGDDPHTIVLSPNRILGPFTSYLKDPANRKSANHVPKATELEEPHNKF